MTQEDKQLLLVDLSARLPYKVKFGCDIKGIWTSKGITYNGVNYICWPNAVALENVKPYLRPMSSMTEEEKKEYKHLVAFSGSPNGAANFVNWLNAHHFDYKTDDEGKTLIEKGLALIAPEGMYKLLEEQMNKEKIKEIDNRIESQHKEYLSKLRDANCEAKDFEMTN